MSKLKCYDLSSWTYDEDQLNIIFTMNRLNNYDLIYINYLRVGSENMTVELLTRANEALDTLTIQNFKDALSVHLLKEQKRLNATINEAKIKKAELVNNYVKTHKMLSGGQELNIIDATYN